MVNCPNNTVLQHSVSVFYGLTFANCLRILPNVQRIIAIALLAVSTATGSGWLNFLHLQEHLSSGTHSYPTVNLSTPAGEGHDESEGLIYQTLLICLLPPADMFRY